MPSLSPLSYNVSGLAHAIGVDQAQVSRWKLAGLPFGKNGKVSLARAVAWIREHERRERPKTGRKEVDDRLAEVQLEREELKLARERAEVAPASDVLAAAEEEASRVRGVLTQLHTEFSPLVAARLSCGLREASAVLREISDGVCARLAAQDTDANEEAA
jgi:phage terminase Nu1 subunit (DNA packaging protein)